MNYAATIFAAKPLRRVTTDLFEFRYSNSLKHPRIKSASFGG